MFSNDFILIRIKVDLGESGMHPRWEASPSQGPTHTRTNLWGEHVKHHTDTKFRIKLGILKLGGRKRYPKYPLKIVGNILTLH